MHAFRILQGFLAREVPSIHAKRRDCLARVGAAASSACGLGVVRMAQRLDSPAALRHRIKCCDRLLSNHRLSEELVTLYQAMCRQVLGERRHIVVIVDWSDLREDGSLHLLRAAAQVEGRAFVIYEEVHPQERYASPEVHRKFMTVLRKVLPTGCKPIILSDAGFRAPWFKMLDKLGYDWIGRIRNRDMIRAEGSDQWEHCKQLYTTAQTRARDLGYFSYVRSNPVSCRLILAKRRPKGRHKKTAKSQRACGSRSKKHGASASEPWLLATSRALHTFNAAQIVELYAGRMQIEQTFRDLKSPQHGLGLRNSQTKSAPRLSILLLIGALLTFVRWLVGLAAKRARFQIRYGSKKKTATTLSVQSLGTLCLAYPKCPVSLSHRAIKGALLLFTSMVRTYQDEG